ncbi:MAG: hypothetical protein WB564_02485 [Dehalococcoidia bacterium]
MSRLCQYGGRFVNSPSGVVMEKLKEWAKAKGIGYTVLARYFIQEKLGLPKR